MFTSLSDRLLTSLSVSLVPYTGYRVAKRKFYTPSTSKALTKYSRKRVTKIQKAIRDVNQMKRAIEMKYYDIATSNFNRITTSSSTNNAVRVINAMPAGTSGQTRIGKRVTLKDIHITGCVTWQTSANYNNAEVDQNWFRLAVVWDKAPVDKDAVGATPVYSTIFQEWYPANSLISDSLAQRNESTKSRFVILYDKVHFMRPPTFNSGIYDVSGVDMWGTTHVPIPIDVKINLRNRVTEFNNDPSGIGAITTGALYAVMIAHHEKEKPGDGQDNHFKSEHCVTRLRFTDD